MMLDSPVDAELVDRCAEAAYVAAMSLPKDAPRFEPWLSLSEYWRRLYRVQAAAVLAVVGVRL